jgi:hypothetical protein
MTSRPSSNILLCAVLLIVTLTGCGSSRLGSFPEFPSQKVRLGKSVILADFLLMKATGSDTASVDLGANKVTADTILRFVRTQLDAKGYNVTTHLLTSMGLPMDSTIVVNVSHTSALDREGEDAEISFHPPIYLYQALRRDPRLASLLESLYLKLTRMWDDGGGYPPVEEIIPLGKAFGGGMIFVFLGGGYEVSAGLELEGTSPSAPEQNAKIGYHSVSQASLHMFVLDSETGGVIWTDRRIIRGGMMYNDKFIRMAGNLLEDLP